MCGRSTTSRKPTLDLCVSMQLTQRILHERNGPERLSFLSFLSKCGPWEVSLFDVNRLSLRSCAAEGIQAHMEHGRFGKK